MTNQSIYSDRWLDLVFENRNKEYGAYQLRRENPKTTLKALGIGFLLMLFAVSIPLLLNQLDKKPIAVVDNPIVVLAQPSSLIFPPEQQPKTQSATPLTHKSEENTVKDVNKQNLIDPEVTEAENAKTDLNTNEEAALNTHEPKEGSVLGAENGGIEGGTGTSSESNSNENVEGEKTVHVAAVLDRQPAFPGGMDKFYAYVAQNFKTPESQLSNSIKVYVSFIIETDGTMSNIKVPRNPGYGLDKEAIRVLKNLKTKWTPGSLNGKPVRTFYNLPILVQQNY
ncbi:energy transducer TonB [Flavobacterium sp.]|uniref:energy transducer TonB n=1 Tax=Flavobacterium sp. TaxID=239 RepID=UPI002626A2E8|nr:energy transducer TonB [Flavobacterium sp.]MDD3004445.1 energy transducer TonB [Flavobacterium sp.]